MSNQLDSDQVTSTHISKKLRGSEGVGVPTTTDEQVATAAKGEHAVLHAATMTTTVGILAQLEAMGSKFNNLRRLLYNSKQVCYDHKLQPLEVEDAGGPHPLGTIPTLMSEGGVFPDDVWRSVTMSDAELDALRLFYHNDFGIEAGERRSVKLDKFRMFVGR